MRRTLLIVSAYTAGAAALAWTVWLAGAAELSRQAAALRWPLVAAAVAADAAAYLCQALRWRLLLANVGQLSVFGAAQAVYVGLFASEVLPLRPGDGVRAWLAARTLDVRVAAVVPSIVVERFFDAVLLAAGAGLTAMFVPVPAGMMTAARILGAAVAAFAALLVYAALRTGRKPSSDTGRRPAWLRSVASEFSSGIRAIGFSRTAGRAFVLSCLLLAGQILAFWLAMRACGIDQSLLAAAAVLTLVRLGTAIPNTPANVGTFHVFTILCLTLFGVDAARAAAFSVVAFVILTVPLWLIGGVALAFIRGTSSPGTPCTLARGAPRLRLWRNAPAWRTGARLEAAAGCAGANVAGNSPAA